MTLKDSFNRTVTAFGERGPLNAGQPSPLASRPGTSDNVEARPDRGASTRSSSRGEVMDGHHDAQSLRRRQAELEAAARSAGGISILEERELLALRAALSAPDTGLGASPALWHRRSPADRPSPA